MSALAVSLNDAALALRQGQVLAYATEAVWGLGCDPFNEKAVREILRLKARPVEKGLIVVAASLAQLQPFLSPDLTTAELSLLDTPTARPTTYLVPFHHDVPQWVTGEHDLLAVRISTHPVVKALCQQAAMPLISTSANPQGLEAARSAREVRDYFGDKLLICEGECGKATRPSTIKNLKTGQVLRE